MWQSAILFSLTILMSTRICQGEELYVAEGYFVVDDSAVQNYVREIDSSEPNEVKYQKAVANLREDFDYIITQVNLCFRSLTSHGFNIEIRVLRLDILGGNILSTRLGTGYQVNTQEAQLSFQNWLTLQNAYNTTGFDFAIHWTGYNMIGGGNSIANVGTICDGVKAAAVAEFVATPREILALAHSLGYLLGASNDGAASSHIMAMSNKPDSRNRWTFSSCSATSMMDYIHSLKNNCLLSTNQQSYKPSMTYEKYKGNLFNPEVICQRSLNSSRSYVCKSVSNVADKDADKCLQDYCRIPNTRLCIPVFVSDGKICDRMKRCTGGRCVHDTTPGSENVDPDCVSGDQRILELPELAFHGTCQAFINRHGRRHCYTSPINETCCNTCKLVKSDTPGCEFGDRSSECTEHLRSQVCPRYKHTLCCDHCKDFINKRSTSHNIQVDLNIIDIDDSELFDEIVPYQVETTK